MLLQYRVSYLHNSYALDPGKAAKTLRLCLMHTCQIVISASLLVIPFLNPHTHQVLLQAIDETILAVSLVRNRCIDYERTKARFGICVATASILQFLSV